MSKSTVIKIRLIFKEKKKDKQVADHWAQDPTQARTNKVATEL